MFSLCPRQTHIFAPRKGPGKFWDNVTIFLFNYNKICDDYILD